MKKVEIKVYPDVKCVGHLFKAESNAEKKAVIIACAMGITQKYYKNLAIHLSENGFDVLTFDYRGTGQSSPKQSGNYDITLIDWGQDISDAIHFLSAKSYQKIYFIGHSIGSQLLGFAPLNQHIEKAIFLASSVGYWKLIKGKEKWISFLKLNTILPLSNLIWGFTNSKAFGQGENYPKGAALQWRKWCHHPTYLKIDQTPENNFFDSFQKPIISFLFSDDHIANEISGKQLLNIYTHAPAKLVMISPKDYGLSKIGHTGFLSRKLKDTFWKKIVKALKDF